MKFGEDLEKVKRMSDPDWEPYWPNYNILKQLIAGLPHKQTVAGTVAESKVNSNNNNNNNTKNRGEKKKVAVVVPPGVIAKSESRAAGKQDSEQNSKGDVTFTFEKPSANQSSRQLLQDDDQEEASLLIRVRGEVIFFKLMHAEVHKAVHFFEETQQNYLLRANDIQKEINALENENLEDSNQDREQVQEDLATEGGVDLLLQMIFQLHQDLSQLEIFAIMTYCGCSKILKKHDKVTGYNTREAFMAKVVHPTGITHTPQLSSLIERCRQWLAHPQLAQHWNNHNDHNHNVNQESATAVEDQQQEDEEKQQKQKQQQSAPEQTQDEEHCWKPPSPHDQQLFLDMIEKLNTGDKHSKDSSSNNNNKSSSSDMAMPTDHHGTSLVSLLPTICGTSPCNSWLLKEAVAQSKPPQRVRSFRQISNSDSSSDASATNSSSSDESLDDQAAAAEEQEGSDATRSNHSSCNQWSSGNNKKNKRSLLTKVASDQEGVEEDCSHHRHHHHRITYPSNKRIKLDKQ